MNKGGLAFFVTMMIAVVFIILALAFAPVIKQFADISMNDSTDTTVGLNCSSDLISDFDKANCTATDSFLPYFIGFLIFAGGAIVAAKVVA